jgi:SAM-dependent methyltransferase
VEDFLKKKYLLKNNIPTFKVVDNSTKKVTDFYKETPFPNYKENDNKLSILEKGNKNLLAAQFKKFIGFKKNVLEVGCGTGQLSIYFSIGTNNNVIGLDPTIESLKLAKNFADKNQLSNINFVNADIFDDVLKDNFFDFIWCNGVLHHTKDPHGAFKILINSLKQRGYVLIGLYNKYGRIRTFIRKYLYKVFGKKLLKLIDPTLRNLKLDKQEQEAWIRDQYNHPIESQHTLDEVLDWFKEKNVEFISSIPSSDFDYDYENIFEKKSKGSVFSRILNQISMIFNNIGSDGGLFIVVGKKH